MSAVESHTGLISTCTPAIKDCRHGEGLVSKVLSERSNEERSGEGKSEFEARGLGDVRTMIAYKRGRGLACRWRWEGRASQDRKDGFADERMSETRIVKQE